MDGGPESVKVDMHRVTSAFINSKAKGFLLIHNHPNATCLPSNNDKEVTEIIEHVANLLGVVLVDHLIVGEDGIYSMAYERRGRQYLKIKD